MRCLAVIFVTVKLDANVGSVNNSELLIIVQKPAPTNAILEFIWWYIFDANSDTQWYYSINGGTTYYIPYATDQVNLGVPVSDITSLKVGVRSSKFFADYDEEPEEDDLLIELFQNDICLKSNSYVGGNKKDVSLTVVPNNSLPGDFVFIVNDN